MKFGGYRNNHYFKSTDQRRLLFAGDNNLSEKPFKKDDPDIARLKID